MPLYGKVVIIKRNGLDGSVFPLLRDSCLIGRSKNCDIRIWLPTVSRVHCMLQVKPDGQVGISPVTECQTTLVNNVPITKSSLLKHKDIITISDRSLRFEYPSPSSYELSSISQVEHTTVQCNDAGSTTEKNNKGVSERQENKGGRRSSSSLLDKPTEDATALLQGSDESRKSSKRQQKAISDDSAAPSSRKTRVSFGPALSPECFDASLPPVTPVRRGSLPRRRVSTPIPKDSFGEFSDQRRHSQALQLQQLLKASTILETSNEGSSSGKDNSPPSVPKRTRRARSIPHGDTNHMELRSAERAVKSEPHAKSKMRILMVKKQPQSLTSVTELQTLKDKSVTSKLMQPSSGKSGVRRPGESKNSKSGKISPVKSPNKGSTPCSTGRSCKQVKAGHSPVPKILAPSTPDSKKSAALLTIHAPHLRSSSKKTRSQKKLASSNRKKPWSEVLKQGLMKRGVRVVLGQRQYTKRTFKGRRAKKPTPEPLSSISKQPKKNPLTSTGHANSPADIVIKKVRLPLMGNATTGKPVNNMPSKSKVKQPQHTTSDVQTEKFELSGFESLDDSPPEAPQLSDCSPKPSPFLSSSGRKSFATSNPSEQTAQSWDISTIRTPEISQEHFVSPMDSAAGISNSQKSWLKQFVVGSSTPIVGLSSVRNASEISSVTHAGLREMNDYLESANSATCVSASTPTPNVCLSEEKHLLHTQKCKWQVSSSASEIPHSATRRTSHSRRKNLRDKKKPRRSVCSSYTLSPATLQRLFRLPHSSPKADYQDVRGIKEMFVETKQLNAVSPIGMKRLLRTPRSSSCDYRDVTGIKRLMRTPRSSTADYRDVRGVKELVRTPKSPLSPVIDVGLRRSMRIQKSPPCDYRNVKGVRELMRTPRSPHCDYSNVSGVKQLFGNNSLDPEYIDPEVLRKLFDAPVVPAVPITEIKQSCQVAKISAEPANTGSRKISSKDLLENKHPHHPTDSSVAVKKSRRKQTTSSPLLMEGSVHNNLDATDIHSCHPSNTATLASDAKSALLPHGSRLSANAVSLKNSPKQLQDELPNELLTSVSSISSSVHEAEKPLKNSEQPSSIRRYMTRRVVMNLKEEVTPSVSSFTATPSSEIPESATKQRRGRKRRLATEETTVDNSSSDTQQKKTRRQKQQKNRSIEDVSGDGLTSRKLADHTAGESTKENVSGKAIKDNCDSKTAKKTSRRNQNKTESTVDATSEPKESDSYFLGDGLDTVETSVSKTSRRGRKCKSPQTFSDISGTHPSSTRNGVKKHGSTLEIEDLLDTPLRSGRRKMATNNTRESAQSGISTSRPATRDIQDLKVTNVPLILVSDSESDAGQTKPSTRQMRSRRAKQNSDMSGTPSSLADVRQTRRQQTALKVSSSQTAKMSPGSTKHKTASEDSKQVKRAKVSPGNMSSVVLVEDDSSGEKENIETSPPKTRRRPQKMMEEISSPANKAKAQPKSKQKPKPQESSPLAGTSTRSMGRVLRSRVKKN